MEIKNRKGARNRKEVPEEVKILLNHGKIEAVNLVESLVIDQEELLKNVLIDLKSEKYLDSCKNEINNMKKKTYPQFMSTIGKTLLKQSKENNDQELFKNFSNHTSDIVRSWACYFIGFDNDLTLAEKFEAIKPFASDEHFSVREEAWFVMREDILNNLEESISILSKWTKEENPYFRRFASEATRPCGVWTKHINDLKESPDLALSILDPLKSDKEKYVQDSVGNWLNDASKSNPQWVKDLCKNWIETSTTKETEKIVKRGLRTISKNASSKND